MYGTHTYAAGNNINNRETPFQITSTKSIKDLKDQSIGMNINQK